MGSLVIWVSRHSILPAQAHELERILGKHDLIIVNRTIPSAEWLVENYVLPYKDRYDKIIVIPVLPLTIIKKLCELGKRHGFEVWWAEMKAIKTFDKPPVPGVHYDPYKETVVPAYDGGRQTYRVMRFTKFYRVRDIVVELEELEGQ